MLGLKEPVQKEQEIPEAAAALYQRLGFEALEALCNLHGVFLFWSLEYV